MSPIFVGFSAIELTETVFAVSLVFGLLPLTPWSILGSAAEPTSSLPAGGGDPPEVSAAILTGTIAGLWAGVGCYLRPSWLLFPPCLVIGLWLLRRTRTRLILGGCTVAFLVAGLLPWGLRNQQVSGHFTLTTFWMGPSLYDGWNPQNTTGDSDMSFFDQENLMSRMSEYEMDREYRERAWEFAFANPGRVVALAWKKTLRYWNPFPNADQFKSRRSLRLVSLGWFIIVFAPALLGAWKLRQSLGVLAMTAGPILYFAALHLVFVSSVRYRLPGEYPLLVLSAIGWESLARQCRLGRWMLDRLPQESKTLKTT